MRWSWSWGCCHFLSNVFECWHMFCFWFHSLLPLNKFWYYTQTNWAHWVIPNSMSGIMSSVDKPGKNPDQFGKIRNFWPVWYRGQSSSRSIWVRLDCFKWIIFSSSEIQLLFTDRALPTIRSRVQILGRESIIITLSRSNIMVAYTVISSRFHPSLTGLTWPR